MKFATTRVSPKRKLDSGTEVKPKIDYFEKLFSEKGKDQWSPKRGKAQSQSLGGTSAQNLFDHFEEQRLNEVISVLHAENDNLKQEIERLHTNLNDTHTEREELIEHYSKQLEQLLEEKIRVENKLKEAELQNEELKSLLSQKSDDTNLDLTSAKAQKYIEWAQRKIEKEYSSTVAQLQKRLYQEFSETEQFQRDVEAERRRMRDQMATMENLIQEQKQKLVEADGDLTKEREIQENLIRQLETERQTLEEIKTELERQERLLENKNQESKLKESQLKQFEEFRNFAEAHFQLTNEQLDIANKRMAIKDTELRAKEDRIYELESELVITKNELQAQEDALVELIDRATNLQWTLNDTKLELEQIVPVLKMETKLNKALFKMVQESLPQQINKLKQLDNRTSIGTQTTIEEQDVKIATESVHFVAKENADPNSPKKPTKRLSSPVVKGRPSISNAATIRKPKLSDSHKLEPVTAIPSPLNRSYSVRSPRTSISSPKVEKVENIEPKKRKRIPIPIWGKSFNTAPASLTTTVSTKEKEVKPKQHKSLKTSLSKAAGAMFMSKN